MAKDSKGKAAVRGSSDSNLTDSLSSSGSKRKRPVSSTSAASSSSSKSKPDQSHKKKRFEKPSSQPSGSSLPGASKIKASIRQTKRLLAKPNLAPGTKIEAKRRLKSLEADLEQASRKQVEKSRASRYHQVKFVERQKLVRRIAKCKRNLAKLESGDSESDHESDSEDEEGSKMGKDELLEKLQWLRELLQYVVQYPADLRYVALFPNAEEGPLAPNAKEEDKSRHKAYQHLERVKKAMQDGELGREPEVELSSKDRPRTKLASCSSNGADAAEARSSKAGKGKGEKGSSKSKKVLQRHPERRSDGEEEESAQGVKGDDFFAQSDDEE